MISRRRRRTLLRRVPLVAAPAIVLGLWLAGAFSDDHPSAQRTAQAQNTSAAPTGSVPSPTASLSPAPKPSPSTAPSPTSRFQLSTVETRAVLGVSDFRPAPYPTHQGYGSTRPATIDNGGDPGSVIDSIVWSSWGGADAYGTGRTSVPQPGSGWYPVTGAQLHATGLGRCGNTIGYREVYIRVPSGAGGPLGA